MLEGRFDESLVEMRRANELDPLSAEYANDMALTLMYRAKYEAAKEQCRKALELAPGFDFAQLTLGNIDVRAGKFSQAIPELEKALPLASSPLGYAYAKNGERGKAWAIVAELNKKSSQEYVSPLATAIIYVGLGDQQRAMDGSEKTYAVRSQLLAYLKIDNIWDPLRSDPRFIDFDEKSRIQLTARILSFRIR
jgi:tetratricopeptide (TPR) repeat protein